jgi:hypothetical protein
MRFWWLGLLVAACSLPPAEIKPRQERIQVEFPDGSTGEVWGHVLPDNPDLLLVEGDILVARPKSGPIPQGFSVEPQVLWGRLWPHGIVPYILDSSVTGPQRQVLQQAIAHIHEKTPVRLKTRENESDYIRFSSDEDPNGCNSFVGRVGGEQRLDLYCGPNGVPPVGTVVHEILHALGFWHEQSRPDRDEWVDIRWENIRPGWENNFIKYGYNARTATPYDYESVMHYSAYAFSKNGMPTIVPKKTGMETIGQRHGLSRQDIAAIQTLYTTPLVRIQSLSHYRAPASPAAYSFTRTLSNTGAVPARITGVASEGFITGIQSTLPIELPPGADVSLTLQAAPCTTAGFADARVVVELEGRSVPYEARLLRACFGRWPSEKVVVEARGLGGARVQLIYAEWGFATRYTVKAATATGPVEVSPAILESNLQRPLYTAIVQVAQPGMGQEVCFTLRPQNSSLSEPAPGSACTHVY